jgi:hypothetical protein
MAKEYYLDWEGEKIPLAPGLIKVARFIAKRTGKDAGEVLNEIVNELVRRNLDRIDSAGERSEVEADARYCEAEGLDLEAFHRARAAAHAEQAYQLLRRDWGAL